MCLLKCSLNTSAFISTYVFVLADVLIYLLSFKLNLLIRQQWPTCRRWSPGWCSNIGCCFRRLNRLQKITYVFVDSAQGGKIRGIRTGGTSFQDDTFLWNVQFRWLFLVWWFSFQKEVLLLFKDTSVSSGRTSWMCKTETNIIRPSDASSVKVQTEVTDGPNVLGLAASLSQSNWSLTNWLCYLCKQNVPVLLYRTAWTCKTVWLQQHQGCDEEASGPE